MSGLIVGVIGAGTMGEGIAQVAAAAGHPVLLYDTRPETAARALEQIGARLAKRVADGKMSAADRDSFLGRISPLTSLAELASCGLVIEAIVEALEPKRALFAELERTVAPEAILATNTSSLSITALARELRHRDRFIGLHFFNPVPVMRLVEIVRGIESSEEVASRLEHLMQAWGKTPVAARSTPGFIVNRIARPFYAEALWLLQERRATSAQIDECLRSAGFRMGPCELMDMIGHDVNYAVTESVFSANFGDSRFVPSQVQRELIEAGRLGRKSGRGFYSYGPESGRSDTTAESPISEGRTAGQVAAQCGNPAWGVFDWAPAGKLPSSLAVTFAGRCPSSARELALMALRRLGVKPITVADAPGLIVGRTIAMLINEAADAVQQGVCDEEAADTAMKLGANYPVGPFQWLTQFGTARVTRLLAHLQGNAHCERYRVSPWLSERLWNETGAR